MGYEEWTSLEPILSSFLLVALFISASFMKKSITKHCLKIPLSLRTAFASAVVYFWIRFGCLNLSASVAASLSVTPEAL